MFQLGPHLVVCGNATDPASSRSLMDWRSSGAPRPDRRALQRPDCRQRHRQRSSRVRDGLGRDERRRISRLQQGLDDGRPAHLCDGGLLAPLSTGAAPTVDAAAAKLGLTPLNLIVWAKTNAGHGEPVSLPARAPAAVQEGHAPHVNNVELGKRGRWRSNVWTYPARPRWAPTHAAALRTIRPSSRPRCSRTRFSI